MANSTAVTPRQSPKNRAARRASFAVLKFAVFMTERMAHPSRRSVGFVSEYGGGGEQIEAPVQIGQIEAEQIDEDRILVIDAQQHDIAGPAGIVAETPGVEA